jgi:hypothetical protein
MGAMAARIESLATDAAAIAAIMATTAPSGRVSMRSWLHTRMSVACPREAQIAPFLGPESRGQKAGLEPCKAMPVGVCMEPESEFKTAIRAQM